MKSFALLVLLPFFLPVQDGGIKVSCDMKKKEDAFYCETCKFIVEEKALEKGKCWKCEKARIKVKVCVKEYYGCRGCSEKRFKPAKCCAGDMVKKVSKVRIIFQCLGTCAKTANKSKTCSDAICDSKGKKYKARCSKQGLYPHGNRNQ